MLKYIGISILLFLTAFDSYMFGYLNEKLRKFQKSIFITWRWKGEGHKMYPVYRIIQGILDIGALYVVYETGGIIIVIGFILGWYFMVKEFGYYIMLNQFENLERFEKDNVDVFWLKRIWFYGYFTFKERFTVKRFEESLDIGLSIIVISYILTFLIEISERIK